jgi:hypothetical protein
MFPALLIAGGIAATGASAQSAADKSEKDHGRRDILVCYQWDIFDEVYKLNIKPHSKLSEKKEEERFEHPRQFAFSIHGKHVGTCGFGSVRPVVGTLISTVPFGQAGGARLGLETFSTTGVPNFCRDVEISCKSADDGYPPKAWECFGQNKFDIEFQFRLDKVVEHEDERCSLFEDGEISLEEQPSEGEGSGMPQTPD